MSWRPVLAITTAWVALLAGCNTGEAPKDALDVLQPCTASQGPLDGYCGTIEVWENRQAKTGRRIQLNVVVLPSARRADNPDPVFFLAGGPGEAAAQMASKLQPVFRPLIADRDIVLVDQRGTGKSHSLACKFDEDEAQVADPDILSRLMRRCMDGLDADLRQYTTPIAMDDLNEVRQALGYRRINLFGGSYGTRAAIVYVRRHPETVRSVVLDSVAPPDLILPLYFARDSQRAFDLMAADCAADEGCAAAFPNLTARFEQLLARLDAQPERATLTNPRTGKPETITVNRQMLGSIVFSALYEPETAALLPFLIERATEGDYSGLLALTSIAPGAGDEMSLGMRYSVVCAEDAPRVDHDAIARETPGTFLGGTMAEAFLKPCEFWPRGDLPADSFAPFSSESPTLLLSGQLDPVTPPAWAEQIAMQWPNARQIVVPGIGHGAMTRGCMMRVIRQFLNETNPRGLDASCAETLHRRPFFLSYAGPVAAAKAEEKPKGEESTGGEPERKPGEKQ